MSTKNVYVFLGPPGSGKGSLSALCVKHLGWEQISAGNLCRQEIALGTAIGRQIDFNLKSGTLVPDSLVIKLVENSLCKQLAVIDSVILDGFPRTTPQAQELKKLLSRESFSEVRLTVVKMHVPDEVVVTRLVSRLICPNGNCQAVYSTATAALSAQNALECDKCASALVRRSDDEEQVVRARLAGYYEHERSLLDFLKRAGYLVHDLSAVYPLNEVFDNLRALIGVQV